MSVRSLTAAPGSGRAGLFSLKSEEFRAHYHRRSNVESTMWMIKSKFGAAVASPAHTLDEAPTMRGGEPAGHGLRRRVEPLGDLARRQRGAGRLHDSQHLALVLAVGALRRRRVGFGFVERGDLVIW